MKRKIIYPSILLLTMLISQTATYGQNEFMMSEQLFSRINKNPAGVGNSLDVDIFMLHRQQWAGFGKGRPITSLINVHSYFEKAKSGAGLTFSHDMLGVGYQTINVKAIYSYQIDLWEQGVLSLGVGAGILHKNFDPRNHVIRDPGDPNFPTEKVSRVNPDFDFGLEFSTPWILFGGAINHLGMFSKEVPETLSPKQSYNAYLRGIIPAGRILTLTPAVMYMNAGQYHIIEGNVTAFFVEKYWLGIGCRYTKPFSAFVASVGFEWEVLRVGYSFELSLGQLTKISSHTHEILLSFKIPTKRCKTNTNVETQQ